MEASREIKTFDGAAAALDGGAAALDDDAA